MLLVYCLQLESFILISNQLFDLWYQNELMIERADFDTCLTIMAERHLHKDDCDITESPFDLNNVT